MFRVGLLVSQVVWLVVDVGREDIVGGSWFVGNEVCWAVVCCVEVRIDGYMYVHR